MEPGGVAWSRHGVGWSHFHRFQVATRALVYRITQDNTLNHLPPLGGTSTSNEQGRKPPDLSMYLATTACGCSTRLVLVGGNMHILDKLISQRDIGWAHPIYSCIHHGLSDIPDICQSPALAMAPWWRPRRVTIGQWIRMDRSHPEVI